MSPLCTVHKDVPLERFASEIIGGLDVFRELAGRLHTRIDVQWTPIGDTDRLHAPTQRQRIGTTPRDADVNYRSSQIGADRRRCDRHQDGSPRPMTA